MSDATRQQIERPDVARRSETRSNPEGVDVEVEQSGPEGSIQHAVADPSSALTLARLLNLQRTVGNRTVQRLMKRRDQEPGAGDGAGPEHADRIPMRGVLRVLRRSEGSLQRAEEAANVGEAITKGPGGPLQQLRDELAKPSPVANNCLKHLGQLGPGERTLVQLDTASKGIMPKLVAALTAKQLLAAVELLGGDLIWSIHWVNQKTGAAAAVGDAAYHRLIGGAPAADVVKMLKDDETLGAVCKNYKGHPLDLLAPKLDGGQMADVVGSKAVFAEWVIKSGARDWLGYVVGNDPAKMIAALKKAGKWVEWLDALAKGVSPAAVSKQLFDLFTAASEADDRLGVFKIRFPDAPPPKKEFDWKSAGEALWNKTEAAEAKKARGPKRGILGTIKDTLTEGWRWVKGTRELDQFRKMLVPPVTDLQQLLTGLRGLKPSYLSSFRSTDEDLDALAKACAGKPKEAAAALDTLGLTGKPTRLLRFIGTAGVGGSIDKRFYRSLVASASAGQLKRLFAAPEFTLLRSPDSGINPLAIPALATDTGGTALAAIIKGYPEFSSWVLAYAGGDSYLQFISQHGPGKSFRALVEAGQLAALLAALPDGPALSQASREAMREIVNKLGNADLASMQELMKKRFALDDVGKAGGTAWDAKSLQRVWELVERLPPAVIVGAFKKLTRGVDSPDTPAGLATQAGEVSMEHNPAKLDILDTGQFTEVGKHDVLEGKKIFDAAIMHEIGHTADFRSKFSDVAGELGTNEKFGKWKSYQASTQTKSEAMFDTLLGANGENVGTDPPKPAWIKHLVGNAIMNRKSPHAAFTDQAAADPAHAAWFNQLWTDANTRASKAINTVEVRGKNDTEPWNDTSVKGDDGRYYHESYDNEWASYVATARDGGKISNYQFRDNMEWFAEVFATFYLTPADPGQLIKAWNADVYKWFIEKVDKGYSVKAKP